MIAAKSLRFFSKFAISDPIKFVDIAQRRAIEQLSKTPQGVATTHFGAVNYELDLSIHRVMRKYFFHTHEMFLERIFDQHLVQGSIFIDIGANCGYWSAYALARVGVTGEVHAFEPVPHYYKFLRRLVDLNPSYRVLANDVAVGGELGRLRMTIVPPAPANFDNYDTNIGSSSLAPGFLDHAAEITETIDVDVVAFDDYARHQAVDIDRIGLIKIDVEGFENSVFDGMQQLLAKSGRKVPILCEILTDRNRSEPLDGQRTIVRLESYGYRCLDATTLRPIKCHALEFEENILCV